MKKKKKIWKLLVLLLIICMVAGISLNAYYIQNNAQTAYIEMTAVPECGTVIFRGMLIDGSWYNPQDIVIDSSTWIYNEREMLYTATDESALHLKIPSGEKFEVTFNVGPEQGKVEIDAGKEKVILDLRADVEIEQGKVFELPMLSGNGLSQYAINRNAAIVVGIVVLIMILAIFLLNRERSKEKEQRKIML